jgi:hypothetical protein
MVIKVTKEEKDLYLGGLDFPEDKAREMIDQIREGKDAPLTEQIFGESKSYMGDAKQALLVVDGSIREDNDPLIEFIEKYQPAVMVERQKFYRELLNILEGWK